MDQIIIANSQLLSRNKQKDRSHTPLAINKNWRMPDERLSTRLFILIRTGTIPANIYMFKVNKKNTRWKITKKSGKYVQS